MYCMINVKQYDIVIMLYVVRHMHVYVNNCCFINCYLKSLHVLLAPSRITNVTVSKGVRQGEPILWVTWTAPQSDVTISQYQVQYRKSGTTVWSQVIRPSTTATLDHVLPGTAYNVRVRAQSAAGDGEWSEVHTETTYNRECKCCYQFHIVVVVSHFQRLQGSRGRIIVFCQ